MSAPGFLVVAAASFALGVFGLRGLLELHDALRRAEFDRLRSPPHWQLTCLFVGFLGALPVLLAGWAPLGTMAVFGAAAVTVLGYFATPRFLESARQRVERELLDDLPLHLDLIALAMEAGSTLPSALAACADRAPEGVLSRAWRRVLLDIHGGIEPLDALSAFAQRARLAPLGTLVLSLRSAQKFGLDPAGIIRERARQAGALRFARAERRARAAPLKLWATLMLCLAPCSFVVLAFPVARLLARVFDR